jgi:potassium/chloride transporter 4/5/6
MATARGGQAGAAAPRARRLGALLGVYTPTILTILGVILYLRFGWVVGNAGIARTLLIVVLANGLTLVTALALSAVATNSRVGVGGAYYMVSRSLGLEIGAAIGLPLFLSQTFSVTLYAFGLAESLRFAWPEVPVSAVAVVIILAVGLLSLRGADVALKAQLPIMGLIGLSLASLTWGAASNASPERLAASLPTGVGFWTVFAVFFPAVTGIMAGVGLSGDLKEPNRAIPLGTIAAQLTGFGVYLVIPLLLALAADGQTLREDPLVWTRIAPLGAWVILPGLWGAIFSSAVGSMLGAPRTLQALALDGIAPRRLARGVGAKGEPLAGLLVSLAIALGAVALGDLNSVAVVVTMFFLTVYGTLNLAAALEDLSGDPSWRPTLRVHWSLCLLGALGCFAVMILIHAVASAVAFAVVLGLWLLLQRRERRADWGDVRRGVYEALIRWALVRLAARPMTARSWRPHILVFTEPIEERLPLVHFGDWFTQDRGLLTVCELVVADLVELQADPLEREREIQALLRRERIVSFAEVNVVARVEQGIVDVAQANGMAGVESNTVMLGWPSNGGRLEALLRVQRRLERLHKSLLIGRVRSFDADRRGRDRTIDVWWGGLQRNGDLMLLLAYLLTRNAEWSDARIRVLSIASNDLMKDTTERNLARLIPLVRIEAEVEVIVKPPRESVHELIHAESSEADVVLLGLATPAAGEEEAYAARLRDLVGSLRNFFLVKNNSLFMGDLVSPGAESVSNKVPLPTVESEPDGEAEVDRVSA